MGTRSGSSPRGSLSCNPFTIVWRPYICNARRLLPLIFLSSVIRCGVLTVEIEHVDAATLEKLEKQGVDCEPKASTITIIQVS